MENKIVANVLITPDGTVLQSYHVHDYKTHIDANGKEYMIDGGLDYARYNVHKDAMPIVKTITMDDPHELRREWFAWGSYGKKGDEPLHWIKLKDMETEHIQACLDEVKMRDYIRELMEFELEYRK